MLLTRLAHSVLHITGDLVRLAFCLVEFAFRLQLLIAGDLASGILYSAFAFSAAPFTCSRSMVFLLFDDRLLTRAIDSSSRMHLLLMMSKPLINKQNLVTIEQTSTRRVVVHNPHNKGTAMRKLLLPVALVAIAIPAMAQQPDRPANRDANTPAVNTPNSPPNPGAPVAGANSFTESQAKSRIESHGFTNVGALKKDSDGVWRGTATQAGKSVKVSVDFQGNVVSQ